MGLLSGIFGGSAASNSSLSFSANQLPSGESEISIGSFSYTIPAGGKIDFTDRGEASLYRIEVAYPDAAFFGVACWPEDAGSLQDGIDTEKDVMQSIDQILLQEESLPTLNACLLTFQDKKAPEKLFYSLVIEINPTGAKPALFLLQLDAKGPSMNKDTLLQVAKSIKSKDLGYTVTGTPS